MDDLWLQKKRMKVQMQQRLQHPKIVSAYVADASDESAVFCIFVQHKIDANKLFSLQHRSACLLAAPYLTLIF